MTALDLSRLQFAVVTIYHYLFVPLSISLADADRRCCRRWRVPQRDARWQRLTLVAGKLLMVTFAVGVVTGLVQEFQFGLSLVGVRPLLRRRLRPDPGDRGHARVLPRGHVPGAVVVRLADRLRPRAAPGDDLDRRRRHADLGVRHPRGQRVHAEPGGLHARPGHRPGAPRRLRRPADQRGRPRRLPAHHRRRLRSAAGRCCWRSGRAGAGAGRRRRHRAVAPARARRGVDDAGRRRPPSRSPATCWARS